MRHTVPDLRKVLILHNSITSTTNITEMTMLYKTKQNKTKQTFSSLWTCCAAQTVAPPRAASSSMLPQLQNDESAKHGQPCENQPHSLACATQRMKTSSACIQQTGNVRKSLLQFSIGQTPWWCIASVGYEAWRLDLVFSIRPQNCCSGRSAITPRDRNQHNSEPNSKQDS